MKNYASQPTVGDLEKSDAVSSKEFAHLDLSFDVKLGVLWKFISSQSTPYFCHPQLDEIRYVQKAVRDGINFDLPNYEKNKLKYLVFASKIPGVFSLGGDLELFSGLIRRADRAGLWAYSRKATDAIVNHASVASNLITFSLVQGSAMGGGFEAALAGNVLVAERGTKLGFPEVLFGLFPGMGAYTLLRRRVDASTAEEIILSAKNYSAEELYGMGVVDILCEPGEGFEKINAYASVHANRSGAIAFRRALNRANVLNRREIYSLADEWVEVALALPEDKVRRIDRLVSNQKKHYSSARDMHTPSATIKFIGKRMKNLSEVSVDVRKATANRG